MRKLFTLMALWALTLTAWATLPVPAVQYDWTVPGLALTFSPEGLFPPVGSAAWNVTLTRDGIADVYIAAPVTREVFLYAMLRPGTYFIQAVIVDVDGVALDATPLFDWTLAPPVYQADIPRVVVGGAEQWDTGLALACHNTGEPVTVTWELYSESGSLVATETVTIEPHAAPAFNFSPYVTAYLAKAEPGIFTGSAVVRANVPVAMTYQCRPYAPGTAPGIAFGMVLQRVE